MSIRIAFLGVVVLLASLCFTGPAHAHGPHGPHAADAVDAVDAVEGAEGGASLRVAPLPESAQRARLMIDVEPGPNPWTSLDFLNDPEAFQFAIVTDRTGGHRVGVFNHAIDKLNLLQPEFVVSVGDLIEGMTSDQAEIAREWSELESMTQRLQMPFFYVAGNHDYWKDAVGRQAWHERFGRTYYSFVYRDVLVLCLNTEDPPQAHISEEQAAFAKKTLAEHSDVRWTLVFMHQPLWLYTDPRWDVGHWSDIETALKDRPHTVYAGHWHRYSKHERNDNEYYVLATTGGSQGQMARYDIPASGRFDHVVWVTMTPEGPRMANLLLEGIQPSDVATEQTQQDTAGRFGALLNSGVYVEPIFAADSVFTQGTLRLHFRNRTARAMDVWARLDPVEGLTLSQTTVARHLEPDAGEVVEIGLAAPTPLALNSVPDLLVRWGYATDLPPVGDVTQRQVAKVRVTRQYTCPNLTSGRTITVDGKLDDWTDEQLPYEVIDPLQILKAADTWTGPDDLRFRFGIAHDADNIYIAVRVRDDRLVTLHDDDRPWEQDGVEVRLDARAEPDRSAGQGQTDFGKTLLIGAVPAAAGAQTGPKVFNARFLPDGVRVVCVKTADGHVTEIAIPRAYLDETQGGPWEAVRLSVAVNDRDDPTGDGEEAVAQLHWLPDWRTSDSYAGSGTFRRE